MDKCRTTSRAVALTAWQKSERFRQIGSTAIKAFHAIRHTVPKCTAIAKSSGDRCGNLAMANGKCWCHGGRTPSGDGWHKPVWPNDGPDGERKLNRKLEALRREAKGRKRKLADATEDERQKYEAWKKSHRPGPVAARERARRERKDALSFASGLNASPMPIDPEGAKLQAQIDYLEAILAANRAADVVDIFG